MQLTSHGPLYQRPIRINRYTPKNEAVCTLTCVQLKLYITNQSTFLHQWIGKNGKIYSWNGKTVKIGLEVGSIETNQ